MIVHDKDKFSSAVFLTFNGNCREALTCYQTCFGGTLRFDTFRKKLHGFPETPIITGTLFSDKVVIHGSDLVHDEGRKTGNHIAIFLQCKNRQDRKELLEKLEFDKKKLSLTNEDDPQLIEVTDAFDVRWVLGA